MGTILDKTHSQKLQKITAQPVFTHFSNQLNVNVDDHLKL